MKILFLHLSDLHLKQNDNIEITKIDKLIEALRIIRSFDECIIICTGDLAFNGIKNEYKNIQKVFGNLFTKIRDNYLKNKFLNFFVVPGNHDANFAKVIRNCKDIVGYYDKDTINDHVEQEIEIFNDFYDYSALNNCFKYDKICNQRIVNFGNYTI